MEDPFDILVLLVIALPIVAFLLRKTRFWMVPGMLLMVGAVLLIVTIRPVHDDVGGIGALGTGLQVMGALVLAFVALLAFALGGIKPRKPAPTLIRAPLPVARTV